MMARSWCGFLPQNQDIKEQWQALEKQLPWANASQTVFEESETVTTGDPGEEDVTDEL